MKAGKPYFQATQKVTEQAPVIKVNAKNRTVWLKTESGDTLEVECGPEVKNFAQIKVGDVVKVDVTEKLTVHVEPGGEPSATTESTSGTAKPGEKPAATATEKTTIKATISAIDTTAGTATLKNYEGTEMTIYPKNKANLKKVKVGDLVVFTHTIGVALKVEKVTASK
jgi:hypothetical protein